MNANKNLAEEVELAKNTARTAAYLEATQDEFLKRVIESKIYFAKTPEAGALAGPTANR